MCLHYGVVNFGQATTFAGQLLKASAVLLVYQICIIILLLRWLGEFFTANIKTLLILILIA